MVTIQRVMKSGILQGEDQEADLDVHVMDMSWHESAGQQISDKSCILLDGGLLDILG